MILIPYDNFRCSGYQRPIFGALNTATRHWRRELRLEPTPQACSGSGDHSATARSSPKTLIVLWGQIWILWTNAKSGSVVGDMHLEGGGIWEPLWQIIKQNIFNICIHSFAIEIIIFRKGNCTCLLTMSPLTFYFFNFKLIT